jgi:anti-sigma-K factor RskA
MPAPPETISPLIPPPVGRGADIVNLQRGVRRWRGVTVAMSALAAILAIYIAVEQFAPGLVPLGRQAPTAVAARPQPVGSRLVAVLQQEPTAPAFLLTLDPQNRTYTVRTVSATPEAGRSYELWLIASKNSAPRSLGLVGGNEFTTRPLPASFDVATMRGANYAISLEPAGGSPKGAPTGPILFTGKMVESVPGSPPPG